MTAIAFAPTLSSARVRDREEDRGEGRGERRDARVLEGVEEEDEGNQSRGYDGTCLFCALDPSRPKTGVVGGLQFEHLCCECENCMHLH